MRTKREYLATKEIVLERNLRLQAGEKRKLEGRIDIPDSALPTLSHKPHIICWIVGLIAELPGWPDAEVAREIIIRS